MNKNILNILDFNKIDALLDGFNKSTGFVTAILDLEGNVLSKSGWRQICTEFHRINPETSKKCTFSDTQLANKMIEDEKYHFYKCLNGLVDVAVPIVINGEHIANLCSGQFFFEEPDISFFKEQAAKYGFDEEKYIAALKDVPVVSKEKVKTAIDFLLNMTLMISEITFQKIEQTELYKAIRESEEKFRAIYENINDAVFIQKILHNGEPGNFLDFNSAALKKLGYTSEELKSMSPRELDDPDKSRQYIPKVMKQLKEQSMSKFEAVQIAKDGRKIDMEVNAVVTNIGGDDHIVSVCRDITEKKTFERILLEKEQFLSAIYTGISQSIFVVDVLENGDFQYVGLNPQHEKITGISSDFIKGKRPEDLLPKEVALNVCKRYTECINLKQTIAYEEWLPFKGKHTCWETILNPRISESGNVYQIIGTSQEITERKQAELLVQEKNGEIAAQNEELNKANKELIEAKEKAEESQAKLNALFASMSEMVVLHELVLDKNGKPVNYRITDCNDAFIKITGISRNAAVGRLSTEVFGTEQPPYLNEFSKVALTGEPYHFETHFHPMDKHFSISVISPEKYRFATVTTDITGHKRAEEALQKSEDSLQAVLNSTADGILAVGRDNKVLYANERFSELWRIPSDILESGDDSIMLQHILDQLSDPEGFLKKVQELYINDKESFDVINFHDGRVFERLSRPLSPKSEVKGRVWSFRDVTERKKAEEEYHKFFTITENSLYGSAIADPDGNLVYVNDYFAHIHGYKAKELIGKKLDIFHSDAQMPLVRKTIEDALEKGSIESVEIHHLNKNGHEFPMLMSVVVIKDPDDKPKYIAATAFDLTEQKTVEQKLQNTVNEQNLMLDNDPTLIFFKDCKNNIIRVTESVAKATGMTREAIEGRHSKEIYPDMADQYWEDDLEVIKSGKPKLNIIEPLTGADGSSHWLLTNKIPAKNNSGEIVGVTVFATDITELKNAELGLIAAKEKAERNEIELVKAQEIAHLGSWYFNTETNEVTWTEELYKMYGFDPAMPPPPYTEHMKLFTPESWEILSTSLAKTRETGIPYELELKTIRNDNSNGWMWVRGEAILDKDNRITGLWGAAQDITERKQAELELIKAIEKTEESEERFNLAMKASNDGIFDWNLETHDIYYSPGWKKMLGYEDHELPNDFSVWETTTAPEDVKKSWELQRRLISKQIDRFVMELKMQHKDGHWVDILSRAEAIFNYSGKAVRIVGTHTDITERRQAEIELLIAKEEAEKNEQKYRMLFDSNLDSISLLGIGTDRKPTSFIEFNNATCEIFGYTREELMSKKLDEFEMPVPENVMHQRLEALQTKGSIGFETIIRDKAGKDRNTEVKVIRINYQDQPALMNITRDITERKKAEEHLQKFKQIVSSTSDGIALLDKNYRYVIVNKAYESFSAKKQDDLIGLSVSEYLGEEVFKKFIKANFDRCLKGETIKYRDWFDYPTLGNRYVEISYFPYIDYMGMISGVVANSRDITENWHAEEALRKSEAIKNTMVSNIGDVIVIIDQNGIIRYKSPNVTKFFGWKPEELIGKSAWDNGHPDDLEATQKFLGTIATEPNAISTTEMRYKRKDGDYVWIEIIVKNLFHDKDIQGILGNYRDITERRQSEKALMMKMDELERYFKLTVGRELTMVELKKEVNNLLNKLGEDKKYKIVE